MTYKAPLRSGVFLVLLLMIYSCKDDRELAGSALELDSLSQALAEQERRTDSLSALLEKSEMATEYPVYLGKGFDSIENPEGYLAEQLKSHPELIPLEPVLGGQMQFREVRLLTERWILATYEDGHIQGRSIYSFKLTPSGNLEFDLVVSDHEN